MKLEDFVYETLKGISVGVTKAKHKVGPLTAIAPGTLNGQQQHVETQVAFDVAVTSASTESSAKSGGGKGGLSLKVIAADVSLGGQGSVEKSQTSENNRVSRITFSVPIILNAGAQIDHQPAKAEKELQIEILNKLEQEE